MKALKKYPALSQVLSLTLDAPLFQDAEVEGNFWAQEEGGETKFVCEPDSVKLVLPPVTKDESETIPKSCQVKVKHHYQDEQARETNFYLTFSVQIEGYEQTQDGMYKPKYTATLEDYEYES